jgi:hypothetical protein
MLDLCRLILGMVIDLLRSRVALEAEILILRQQRWQVSLLAKSFAWLPRSCAAAH